MEELRKVLVCPRCLGALEWEDELRCLQCASTFSFRDGIPSMVAFERNGEVIAREAPGLPHQVSFTTEQGGRKGAYRYERGSQGAPVGRPEYPYIVEWVPRGSRVLDLGCGEGSLGLRLIEKGCTVSGIDLSPEGVEQALTKGVTAQVGDIDEPLGYPDESFDIVIINVTLQMVYRPKEVLTEALRVGAEAIVSFPNLGYWQSRVDLLLKGRFPRKPLYGHPWHQTRHIHLFTHRDFCRLLDDLDAQVKTARYLGGDSRSPGRVAAVWPNLFAMLPILWIERRED